MRYHKRRGPNEPERSIRETDPISGRFAAAKANAELAEKLGNVMKAEAQRKEADEYLEDCYIEASKTTRRGEESLEADQEEISK